MRLAQYYREKKEKKKQKKQDRFDTSKPKNSNPFKYAYLLVQLREQF